MYNYNFFDSISIIIFEYIFFVQSKKLNKKYD